MSWIEKIIPALINYDKKPVDNGVPKGLWGKCPECDAMLYQQNLEENLFVCPKCDSHQRISARVRIAGFLDKNNQTEIASHIVGNDPLKFKDQKKYKDRYSAAQKNTGEKDALVAISGFLKEKPVVVIAFEFKFMGGSMGSVVGEKFVQAVYESIKLNAPLVCFSSSGGARMQEGLYSLLQMSKTAVALNLLTEKKLPFISVLTDPTMGGVSASFAMLGDINIAEPNALIGFAGARIIEQTVREDLPKGFQRSEFLLEKGAIDMIVPRGELPDTIAGLLKSLTFHNKKSA